MNHSIKTSSISKKIDDLLIMCKNLFNENKIDETFKILDEALSLDRNYAKTYLIKGEILIDMFYLNKAEQYIKTYLKFIPNDKNAYLDLMKIYDKCGNFHKAIYYCDKLITEDSKNSSLYFKKANFLNMSGYLKDALNCCQISLKLNPKFYDALCLKGTLLSNLDKPKDAIEAYSKAIKLNTSKSQAYLEMSLLYKDIGNLNSALEYIKKAYKLNPKNEWCKYEYLTMRNI